MARKSPRARRNATPKTRLPGRSRPQSTPGSARVVKPRTARSQRASGARHAAAGERSARPKTARPKLKAVRRTATRSRARRFVRPEPERVAAVLDQLQRLYPHARTALDFRTPLQLLIATILSAQCTDARVNQVTPALFERWPH